MRQSVILYYNRHSILVSFIDQLSTSSSMIMPPQQPSGRVLASSVSWFQPPSQGPHFTKDVINMVPVVPLFSPQHAKGEILALSEELRQDKNVNLIQKSFKVRVIGRCGGDKKPMSMQNRQKSNANLKKQNSMIMVVIP